MASNSNKCYIQIDFKKLIALKSSSLISKIDSLDTRNEKIAFGISTSLPYRVKAVSKRP